jgi:hypothetical protein
MEDYGDDYINLQLKKLKNPKLVDGVALKRKDFFEIILLIKLKCQCDVNKEVNKN